MTSTNLKPIRQRWQGQLIGFLPFIAGGLIFIVLPPLLPSYFQFMMAKIVIFAIFAISLDVIYGYTGLFSLGHAAFFGAGGYAMGILMVRYGINSFWIGAPLGILVAGLVAAVFGVIALRVSGTYFLLVTFALGQVLFSVATQWDFLSPMGGTEGIFNILRPDLGFPFTWNATNFYYFVFLIFAICYFLIYRFVNSPFGYALQGIRENEHRVRSLGYNTWLYKYIAIIIAGLFAGVAGVLIAYHKGFVVPTSFGIITSALPMLMVMIGGAGTLYGPVIGSAVIIFIELFASAYAPERWPLILGGAFILAVVFVRGGIGVHLSRLWRRALLVWKP